MQVAIDRINRLIYVADSGNHAIRTISMDDGAVATMIGTPDGEAGFNDGGCKDCSYCAVLLLLCFWFWFWFFLSFFFFACVSEHVTPSHTSPPKPRRKRRATSSAVLARSAPVDVTRAYAPRVSTRRRGRPVQPAERAGVCCDCAVTVL